MDSFPDIPKLTGIGYRACTPLSPNTCKIIPDITPATTGKINFDILMVVKQSKVNNNY
jgi:hypothetical protein